MNNNTTLKILVAVISTLLISLLVIILIGTRAINKEEKAQNSPVEFSQYKENFINGCSEDGDVSKKTCECMYNAIMSKYGNDGMVQMATEFINDGSVSDKFVNTAMQCID